MSFFSRSSNPPPPPQQQEPYGARSQQPADGNYQRIADPYAQQQQPGSYTGRASSGARGVAGQGGYSGGYPEEKPRQRSTRGGRFVVFRLASLSLGWIHPPTSWSRRYSCCLARSCTPLLTCPPSFARFRMEKGQEATARANTLLCNESDFAGVQYVTVNRHFVMGTM